MAYAGVHERARATVERKGAAVTFAKRVTTASPSTGVPTSTLTQTSGFAIQVEGDPQVYLRLSLVESAAPTLFFIPTTYDSVPEQGARCTWGGQAFTVRDVRELAPDGMLIGAHVVISR